MVAMQILSKSQEVTADNLANINTPGFKGNKVFYHMLKENVDGEEVVKTVPKQQIDLTQGILEPTGNVFDIGIDGDGFFVVQENGQQYLTRDGRFHLDSDGYLVNSYGANVIGTSGEIQLPEYYMANNDGGTSSQLLIAKDGTIRVDELAVDKLQLLKVDDPALLQRKGSSYFTVENTTALSEVDTGVIMQGFYEKGNVEPLNEMVDMMKNMQMFETQQKAMRTSDEILSRVTSQLGKL